MTKTPDEIAIDHLSQAYLDLLRMPMSGVRARSQACLSAVRDALAIETGDTPEHVQDFYEEWAIDPAAVKRRVLATQKEIP